MSPQQQAAASLLGNWNSSVFWALAGVLSVAACVSSTNRRLRAEVGTPLFCVVCATTPHTRTNDTNHPARCCDTRRAGRACQATGDQTAPAAAASQVCGYMCGREAENLTLESPVLSQTTTNPTAIRQPPPCFCSDVGAAGCNSKPTSSTSSWWTWKTC